jgi:dipeptidyl aminopeptidase/acylaminoacyl peptidase
MKYYAIVLIFLLSLTAFSQENVNYQKPSKEILDLVDVERAPGVLFDDKKEFMILLYRDAYKSIQELSQEEMRLGGLRIDPKTNIGSRTTYYNNIKIKDLKGKGNQPTEVSGMPENPRLANFSFSPDEKMLSMTHTTSEGVELWVIEVESAKAIKLTEATINANLRDVINWFEDGKNLLVKMIPSSKQELINTKTAVPSGPTISLNEGKKAQNRTYQDLLKNKTDEFNFEQLAYAELVKVSLDGKQEKWLASDMFTNINFSPDGNYVMVTTIKKPFSYLVPYYRFPSETVIYAKNAQKIQSVVNVPLIEDLPKGFMAVRKGKRNFSWRADQAATLVYAVALDDGDPQKEVPFRDEIFELEAPFNSTPKSLLKTINRISRLEWADKNTAIARDRWFSSRNEKTYLFDPSDPGKTPIVLFDRNYQDVYSDPGNFVKSRNEFGSNVVQIQKGNAFLVGRGFTKDGQFPFIEKLGLSTEKKTRIYTSPYTDKKETISDYDPKKNEMITRLESPKIYPNYYTQNLKSKKATQLTFFQNPFKSIQNVHKEVIKYKREDGIDLSGTLYLPVGYNMESKEKMPMIMWAYPTEFKDKATAGQNTQNPNEFTYPYYGSMIYWVSKGYVVLDDASFPIVGVGSEEPNDSFRKQLVGNAKAAIDAVDQMGYIDRNKVAVGGHSYGAFMVANLLSHSDLFAAGIARSGAYNRTLTPFGFQREERSYWEAPEVYYTMSPFMHAEKMKTPLLLIHGEADNNSGTYPMQSERYFNALKGLGATTRLVILPKESHGYRAKESILHLLWEQDQWLDKYVKNNDLQTTK